MTGSRQDADRFIALLSGRAVATETFSEADWQHIIELAQKQSVAPMLYVWLKERGITPTPTAMQQLREIYLTSAVRNTRLLHEVGNILRALQAADIPVIPLKGACLAEAVYGNIALRPMGDVDLLVKEEDVTNVVQVLSNLGYSAGYDFLIEDEKALSRHLPPLTGPKKLTIEVHWNVVEANHSSVLKENEIGYIWRRARPAVIAEVPVFMLSPEDLLLHLCVHLSIQHLFNVRLRSFLDIRRVVECYGDTIDWELVRQRARRWGVDRALHLTLYLAEQWVGLNLPEKLKQVWILEWIDPDLLNWIEARVSGELPPYTDKSKLPELIARRGIPARVRTLWQRFFRPTTIVSRQFKIEANSWKVYLYYLVDWLSLFKSCGPTVWSALRGDVAVKTHAQRARALRQWLAES